MVQKNFQVQGCPWFEQRCHIQFLYSSINPNILNITFHTLRIILKKLFVYNVLIQWETPFLFLIELDILAFFNLIKATHFHCREFEKFRKSVKKITTHNHYSEISTLNFLHIFPYVSPDDINELLFYVTFLHFFSAMRLFLFKEQSLSSRNFPLSRRDRCETRRLAKM